MKKSPQPLRELDFVHCHRSPDGTFDGCNVAAKGPFHRYATVLTLQCNVNYLEPGDGILLFARCRTEMKKCSHPCFGGVLCTYGGSRMDKVELRSCERIAGATARSHSRLGNPLIALGMLPSRDGNGAVVAIFSRLLTLTVAGR